METIDQNFQTAVNLVNNLTKKPTNEELLMIYGLYKQATVGDVNTDRPGMLDLKGKHKWDSWEKNKGMNINDAKQNYVNVAMELLKKYQQ
tara:strand:- start:365 stop:634 length:270 start_codon:yes stop_codon:yes gene_type:complete